MVKGKTAVFISGGGTNLQALINAAGRGFFGGAAEIALVISSSESAYGLVRARRAGIETAVFPKKNYGSDAERDRAVLKILRERKIEFIALAGYMSVLTDVLTDAYADKIINVHPALIPSFCGKGFYGVKVHAAALDYGVKVTGATVHFVTGGVDEGAVILQEAVKVKEDDTPETLQKRVLKAEHKLLPRALKLLAENKLEIKGRRVIIHE